ncbi:MAG TPA: LytTR family DNA-binding domain-containing protein [Bacteroidia bacterium]
MTEGYKDFKCVIVDDDPQNILLMEHILNTYFENDFSVVGTFVDAREALKFINQNPIDAVFLDVEMPELNGFDLIEASNDQYDAKIILVSSHDHYALKAFKHSVFDYLVKPVTIKDMSDCLKKLNKDRQKQLENEIQTKDNILLVNRQDKTIFLDINQISRLEAAGSYTDIYLCDGSKISSTKKINHFEGILNQFPFYKLHRSHLVNLNKIKEILKYEGDGLVVMQDGSKIEISRAKKDEFLRSIMREKKV